jgi:hypothetical protein
MRSPLCRFPRTLLTAALFLAGLLFAAPRHAWAQG